MILQRRNFFSTLLGCAAFCWSGAALAQAPAAPAPNVNGVDAAAAVSNSASLPPPAPLPASTVQALATPPTALPALPAAPAAPAGDATGLPDLTPPGGAVVPPPPPPAIAPGAPVGVAPEMGVAAPEVTIPLPPAPATLPDTALAPIVAGVPGPAPDVPPVVVPTPPAPLPNIIEPAKEIAPANEAPLVSTASGGPLLPTIPNDEVLASRRLPLPELTPSSPLIPGPSLAETTNQERQLTTLPGSGGDTNYAYATIGGPGGPARPLITPPSIVDTVQGTDIGKSYPPLQAVMPQAYATPFHLDNPSAFGTPNPPTSLTYYHSKTMRRSPDMLQANPLPTNAEIIVLKGGQEFQGLVQQRGDVWQVELLNGTVVELPGEKVASIRKLLPVPTSTPSARSQVFPTMELYRERQTD